MQTLTPNPNPSSAFFNGRRRPNDPVLIVEDREENQQILAATLTQLKIHYFLTSNGEEALSIAHARKISLFIVDLMMPVMDGATFIEKLREFEPEAVIVVQTAIDSADEIIRIMKMGVYDYLIKPLNLDLLKSTLEKALEFKYLRDMEAMILKEESKDLREQLEWLNFKESSRKTSTSSLEFTAISNLKTLLNQGSGFGSMTLLIDGIKDTSTKDGSGQITVDPEFYDLLIENNEHTKQMLKGLERVLEVFEITPKIEKTNSEILVGSLPEWSSFLDPYLEEKKIQINYPISKKRTNLALDFTLMSLAWKEIILNAFKYANSDTVIDIFVNIVEGYYCLAVKNSVSETAYGKFEKGQEKDLVLPFYRVHPPVESVFREELFGMGLGLTIVDHIANKLGGMFFIRNAKDHTTLETSLCVVTELFLPITDH